MNIGKKFLLITSGIVMVCMAALGMLSHTLLKEEIVGQYQEKAEVLLYSMKAVRQHFREVVRPSASHELGQERFITDLQSTSFAAKGVFDAIAPEHLADMTFRIASTKPLNPANKATPLETDLINTLSVLHHQGQPLQWRGVRVVDGVETYIIAVGEVNKAACLRCHSTREAAPDDLKNKYDFSGPPRVADRVESAEIVAIPMSSIASMVARTDKAMLLLGAAGFLLITTAMYGSFSALIRRPVARLERHASSIAHGDLDHEAKPFRGEFARLKEAMDCMVTALKEEIDQTAAQKAEVLTKHEQLMTIINSSTDLIHFKDKDQRYVIANQAYETVFGVKPEDTTGKRAHDFVSADFANQCEASDLIALREGHCQVVERWGDRWYLTIKKSVSDADGNLAGLVGVIRDITETRRTQDLEVQKARAEAASKAKTEFLAIMSHEIRTPMNVMLGMVDLLEETTLSSEQEECLAILHRSSSHLMELINDILDFSKIEAGEVSMRVQPFALAGLLADVQDTALKSAQDKGLKCIMDSEVDDDSLRLGDTQRLMQVLMNLIQNSIAYTPKGFVKLLVTQDDENNPDQVTFSVSDSGIGIPEDTLPTIFDAFTQADTDMNIREGGTGLGLAICKRLIRLMGGDVSIESRVDQGTTVTFTVPLPRTGDTPTAPLPSDAAPAPTSAIRILLAEDMADNRMLMERYLEKADVTVDYAHDGLEAVEKAKSRAYDIILMDIRMPHMDGIEATKTIRNEETEQGLAPIPIVALTAHAFSEFRDQCMGAGCTEYLTKPIAKKDLLATIEQLTSQRD